MAKEIKDGWIIGGGEIYKKFLAENLVESIFLSIFDTEIEGDTYFPLEFLKDFKLKQVVYYKTFKQEIWEKIR